MEKNRKRLRNQYKESNRIMSQYLTFPNISLLIFFLGFMVLYIEKHSIIGLFKLNLHFAPVNVLVFGKIGSSLFAFISILLSLATVFSLKSKSKRIDIYFIFSLFMFCSILLSAISYEIRPQIWFLLSWFSLLITSYVLIQYRFVLEIDLLSYLSNVAFVVSAISLVFTLPNLNQTSELLKYSYVNEWGNQRLRGATSDYELTAEILILGFISASVLSKKIFSFQFLKFVLISIVLVLTGTRAAFLAPLGALICWIFLKKEKLFDKRIVLLTLTTLFSLYFFGSTLIDRFISQQPSTLESKFNREKVWNLYDKLNLKNDILGRGPYYPFEKYGFFPHSLFKSLLYIGGWITVVFFALAIAQIIVKNLRIITDVDCQVGRSNLVLLLVFLIDQTKVEFTRSGGYIFFIGIFLAVASTAKESGRIQQNRKGTEYGIVF